MDYLESTIKPLLGTDVEYLGEVDHETKLDLLGRARLLLNPISWPEPFGMVMIEALACGTPVVTTPFGAAPEIVDNLVTGFVRSGAAALVDAVGRIDEIDRRCCRGRSRNFSLRRMVDEHVELYRRVLDGEW